MGKFDLTTDTCGRGNFRMRKEVVADSKIPGYLWTGPQYPLQFQLGGTLGPHGLIPRINQTCDQAVLLPLFFASPPNFALPRKEVKGRMIAARICYGVQANQNSG